MKEMRPTTGRVLLALFNILGPLEGMSFLDLFSGSGQVAFEAEKRGAESVCFVESERKRYVEIVKKAPKGVKSFCIDARRAVSKFSKNKVSFDIIFADPPYDLGWGQELPKLIDDHSSILSDNGFFIYEHSVKEDVLELDSLEWSREDRVYGSTVLTFYKRRN